MGELVNDQRYIPPGLCWIDEACDASPGYAEVQSSKDGPVALVSHARAGVDLDSARIAARRVPDRDEGEKIVAAGISQIVASIVYLTRLTFSEVLIAMNFRRHCAVVAISGCIQIPDWDGQVVAATSWSL